jgi:hypothetical protein
MRKESKTTSYLLNILLSNDFEFAKILEKEYNVPIDDLLLLMYETRFILNEEKPKWEASLLKKYNDIKMLFSPDVEIDEVIIKSNKGSVSFNKSNPLFFYFRSPIDRIKWNIPKKEDKVAKVISTILWRTLFTQIQYFFINKIPIRDYQMIAVGMYLSHFKIYSVEPIQTEEEWSLTESPFRSWKNYLVSRVKPIWKNHY